MKKDTLLTHVARDPAKYQGMVNTPVYRTSTVIFPDVDTYEARGGDDYKLMPGARRFACGNYNYAGAAAVHASLAEIAAIGTERIERRITLRGPLSRDQKARLLEIAEKCPVHRTLQAEVMIDTWLREEDAQ